MKGTLNRHNYVKLTLSILAIVLMLVAPTRVSAQIVIKGNVYGGGNHGDTGGNTAVNVYGGDIHCVYGGARMADVKGGSFVHIDGEHASNYVVIDKVYGGNDIAGNIGSPADVSAEIPTELTEVGPKEQHKNPIDKTWNTFVRISTKTDDTGAEADDAQKIYIGQLFGGGDGDYDYTSDESPYKGMSRPDLGKTYLEILGGSIVYAYGGGNNATITGQTVIALKNPSAVVSSIIDANNPNAGAGGEVLNNDRFEGRMGINTAFSYPSSDAYQIGRFFGGNNKADMAIRPRWNLQKGKIRNLYGGGNEGRMTSPEGLLMQIEGEGMVVENVYGGCRKADVKPLYNNDDATPVPYSEVQLPADDNPNNIPAGYAARVRVVAGHVTNVYGGNDIAGNVYAGNTVGIMTRIYGDVYGGGNGSYAYTDNPALKDNPRWSDFYYNPDEVLAAAGVTGVDEGLKSVTALNLVRPNAEKVSILVRGTEGNPTIVNGGLYVGGNSASLRQNVPGIPAADQTHIKIGSYAIIDNVFLGNNGANMIKTDEPVDGRNEGVLRTMARTDVPGAGGTKFNSMDLTNQDVFAKYMEGCAMKVKSAVVFESTANGDAADYVPFSTQFGSFYCGGNVGSMITEGKTTVNFSDNVIVYNKVVGGCNSALVTPTDYNAIYEGGMLGSPDPAPAGSADNAIGDKLVLNISGLKIQPKRWDNDHTALIWNTVSSATGLPVDPVTSGDPGISTPADLDRRFDGGNIYGGCYTSGIVNGNVVININNSIVDRSTLFDRVEEDETGEDKLYGNDQYHILERRSGVILSEQGMDVLGKALNVFGGGKGIETEIWGSVTVNLNRGYTFQIFGGSEEGAIGKRVPSETERRYTYDSRYSTYINLNGTVPGVSRKESMSEDIAECEFMYGGGFLGVTAGNCIINLGNGRIFDSFAGACNANVLGHTETYIGTNGFPYVRDFVYGGNDLGGQILNTANFDSRLRNADVRSKVYNTDMLNASAYIEYVQGRVEKIFGGAYGVYDYKDPHYGKYFYATSGEGTTPENEGHARPGYHKPFLDNAFINFRPNNNNNTLNTVKQIYGAGQGYLGEEEQNLMQNRSYILIDVPQIMQTYKGTEVFGAGESGGVGMGVEKATADATATAHKASAIIDLLSGQFKAVYGGSYQEGVTRRTVVNVPSGSTFRAEAIFGGAYGLYEWFPCDVWEANVNWSSSDALVGGYRTGLYGGNNNCRRTFYGRVNVNAPVYYDKTNGYLATVYGAGYGKDTWSQYTEVNLNNNARVYEVYGGGQLGRVMNKKTVAAWAPGAYTEAHAAWAALPEAEKNVTPEPQEFDLSIDTGYTDNGLNDPLATARNGKKYNTNVIIRQGADVCGYMFNGSLSGAYAYGGGLGDVNVPNTGDVHGTTYIGLLGGKVTKDLYAAGTVGSVNNKYNIATDDFDHTFIASANAYIEGGTARNVYGGGWRGSVGYHEGAIDASRAGDILGETNVIIGKKDGTSFINGLPAIERNAYGGGEGGAVFGTTNITLNKGFIGYRHFDSVPTTDTDLEYIKVGDDYYQEKLHDETWSGDGSNRLNDSGCIFGGGYIDNSSVDFTNVKVYGGVVRNALFGGGEIAVVGRGVIEASGVDNSVRTLKGIYKAGKTSVDFFEGEVHRNLFGGGRGYNNLGEGGTLYSDGYVFGQTEVHMHSGTVGTAKELARGNGNVFGGGDIGYVYSAYEGDDGKLYVGIKDGDRYDNQWEGYYYAYKVGDGSYTPSSTTPPATDPNWVMDGGEYVLTEDCKVLIEPYARVTSGSVSYDDKVYNVGDYVPTAYLHTLGNRADNKWNQLDDTGITIYNAVFAGGNTSSGSSTVYANATTVFGNATASIHDVYHRDLITLGTGRTGGLYGDGNLTFVDGYRGLNITNYGTDYYNIAKEITKDQYDALPVRERAYYQLRYKCVQECEANDGTKYHPASGDIKASILTIDDLLTLFENNETILPGGVPNPEYWKQNGVCSIYAGRLMNTLQRADFCGVFGSRMVMEGAEDRVPEIADHTKYTINRVREVSLNHKESVIATDKTLKAGKTKKDDIMDQNPEDFVNKDKAIHGNYFGIYSVVNYLGALTSDAFFLPEKNIRYTENASNPDYKADSQAYSGGESKEYGEATFYDWKAGLVTDRKRNNGTSLNKVALASGVYLELTTEKSTGTDLKQKDWGYITGVVELDLINVQPGMGGGFVYAKNVHKLGSYTKHNHNTLTSLNANAVTRRDFTFNGAEVEWETSGNFIHSTQTIIDDCYNVSGKYKEGDAVPAHYWFIQGSVYVYDQYISAYTGAPNAYSETVDIPLTITAASHGTMKLLNVMPNKYAYYSTKDHPMTKDQKIVINEVEYHLNDPINYWDWFLLTPSEKALFVDQTYVTIADSKYSSGDADIIPAGTVMLPSEYATAKAAHQKVYHVEKQQMVDFDFVYRPSNNISHDTGYILTYKVNNPTDWDTWYTKFDSDTAEKKQKDNEMAGYEDGPTYHLASGDASVLGQREYKVSNLISKDIYDTYQTMDENHHSAIPAGQATFEGAYLVTKEYTSGDVHLNVGSAVSATQAAGMDDYVAPAFISTSTIQLSKTEYIYVGARMTEEEKNKYETDYPSLATTIEAEVVPAYYCTKEGLYGGNYYEAGRNYRALEVWSSMSKTDRDKFEFNYDALDVLIDPRYDGTQGQKYQYDSAAATEQAAIDNLASYSLEKPVDYKATYNGSETSIHNGITLEHNKEYSRIDYEKLPNEKRHYTTINVAEAGDVYVVKTPFQVGNTPYAVGTVISASTYGSLSDSDKENITTLEFTDTGTYHYCRESYKVGENTEGETVTGVAVTGGVTGTYAVDATVPVGVVITDDNFDDLKNWQTDFTIHGVAPTETSTLYVSRFSDIFDLSKEKIITVIYQYDYEEADATGTNITPVSERHVVNIHVLFKSGIPTVEDIKAPQTVLPGTYVGVREPHVTPGAYEITGGGWKIFEKKSDAESHINGIEYTPTADPLYWYQNGYYLAYYAKTYLGETYSNAVPLSVANYHDLKTMMEAGDRHHYYIDHKDATSPRNPKVYINDYTADGKNGLDMLSDLYKLTLGESVTGYEPFDTPNNIRGAENLDIIFRTNVEHSGTWTPIGGETCFGGNVHGDGHYVSGLDNSLFGSLCGKVYNLGVEGSFTSGGIANNGGSAENCWVKKVTTGADITNPIIAAGAGEIINSYYLSTTATPGEPGGTSPIAASAQQFYTGEVAYNLNRFYLLKRYNLNRGTQTVATDTTYVTSRYGNPDFIYADGVIPEVVNPDRVKTDTPVTDPITGEQLYVPLYPYDYLFFGQALTYGHIAGKTHQDVPSPIAKDNDLIDVGDTGNRVYRAPAYFRNSTKSKVYFSPNAVFAKTDADEDNPTDIHRGLTAIDFTGHDDAFDKDNGTAKAYSKDDEGSEFFAPLLDVDEISGLSNYGLTKNLLVYTEEAPELGDGTTAAEKTAKVVQLSLHEPEYPVVVDKYGRVAAQDSTTVNGHWVYIERDPEGTPKYKYWASNDHLLIDKNDFWAPMGYEFDSSSRMWYQRTPDIYSGTPDIYSAQNTGWESIVLPFTVETVSTHQKGEITHFYGDSNTGHEYWLREYKAIADGDEANTMKATFTSMAKASNSEVEAGYALANKEYTNTFLWDELHEHLANGQNDYYSTSHDYAKYPLQRGATPYIIGFPGKTFYEFDLSGQWTAPACPSGFERQVVTFASTTGITINKSDDDMAGVKQGAYTFTPSYLNQELAAGTDNYVMAADGSKYVKVPATGAATPVLPFRAYFAKSGSGHTLSIVFSDAEGKPEVTPDQQKGADDNEPSIVTEGEGGMTFTPGLGTITTKSTLKEARTVLVYGVGGALVKAFDIKPNSTVTINVPSGLVYAIRTVTGDYSSKLMVR